MSKTLSPHRKLPLFDGKTAMDYMLHGLSLCRMHEYVTDAERERIHKRMLKDHGGKS